MKVFVQKYDCFRGIYCDFSVLGHDIQGLFYPLSGGVAAKPVGQDEMPDEMLEAGRKVTVVYDQGYIKSAGIGSKFLSGVLGKTEGQKVIEKDVGYRG